ncbi:MAG: hypothetical protein V9H69_28055 [Anaerolineae bacterium]
MTTSGSKTILAVTVGGSCQPVVTAIGDYQPHHVVFIASDGPRGSKPTVDGMGKPCSGRNPEDEKPSITAQTGLQESQFTIRTITDPELVTDLLRSHTLGLDRCPPAISRLSLRG